MTPERRKEIQALLSKPIEYFVDKGARGLVQLGEAAGDLLDAYCEATRGQVGAEPAASITIEDADGAEAQAARFPALVGIADQSGIVGTSWPEYIEGLEALVDAATSFQFDDGTVCEIDIDHDMQWRARGDDDGVPVEFGWFKTVAEALAAIGHRGVSR